MLCCVKNAKCIKNCTYLNEIYSRLKRSLYPPEKTLSRQRFFQRYNEPKNVAINLTQTYIAQNAKCIKSALAYLFCCVVFYCGNANQCSARPLAILCQLYFAISLGCGLMFMLVGSSQWLFQARTGLAANILRLPFATASACWLKNYECNHVNYKCNHVVLRKKMPSVQKLHLPK